MNRTLIRCFVLLFAPMLLTCCAFGQAQQLPADTPDPKLVATVTEWLATNAIPLKSVEAGNGFDDLRPLEKVLKGARVVALGEATHGSREFFQFKHRMLEFLVTRMGFTAFSIEASYPACMNINDYVVYGKGDRAKALASQGFWTWDTNEVSDMIDWMRAYNSKLPESKRVRFVGYDIQHYTQAFDVIRSYLKKVAPDFLPTAEATFKPLQMAEDNPIAFMEMPVEKRRSEMKDSDAVLKFLDENRSKFIKQTSPKEFETVRLHARVLYQFADAYGLSPMWDEKNPANSGGAKRDRYMAENIETLMNQLGPSTRMVVWAHNGHIATNTYGNGIPAMGSYLRKAYGDAYYALGFTFNRGSFQSREIVPGKGTGGLKEFTVGDAPEFSTGWYFARGRESKQLENYIVDFRHAPQQGVVSDWLSSPHPSFSVGSGFSSEWPAAQYMAPEVPRSTYDGLIFINQTTRARPNPTGMRGPAQ